jgi:hypothetical protein
MATGVVDLSRYDLTRRMAPYLDPHFMFPIMRWLREKNIYPEAELLAAEYQLANSASSMVHFVATTHVRRNGNRNRRRRNRNRQRRLLQGPWVWLLMMMARDFCSWW